MTGFLPETNFLRTEGGGAGKRPLSHNLKHNLE